MGGAGWWGAEIYCGHHFEAIQIGEGRSEIPVESCVIDLSLF